MKTNRFYLVIALLGAAALIASASVTGSSYAQPLPKVLTKPPPPSLWVLNETVGPSISIFPAARLKRKTGLVGSLGITSGVPAAGGLTFDSNNDLWFGLCNTNSGYLVELTRSALLHMVLYGSVNFSTVIQDPVPLSPEYLSCPRAMQFDRAGNLWVEVDQTLFGPVPTLLEYTSAQLSASGNPVPAVIQTPTVPLTYGPVALALDPAGNLWQSRGTILEFTAAQLAAGVQTDPTQTLIVGDAGPALNSPSSITFDTLGNLWVAFDSGGTLGNTGGLEMFGAADLNGSGTVTSTPATTINAALFDTVLLDRHTVLSSFDSPDGLAFDSVGNLWIANTLQPAAGLGGGSLVEFSASELSTSGSPVPVRAILANHLNTNLGVPHHITFGPALP
jgi:hypothetical protein